MKKFVWPFRLVVLSGLIVFMFWRCRYGFANVDEAFNLHMAYRLWQGDALFCDGWELQQLFGALMLPVMWLYMTVVGSTDGIFLNFRYIFNVLMILTAIVHYIRWRKYDDVGAFWGSTIYLLSVPFTVLNLTYNSMGVICFSLAITLFFTNDNRKMSMYFLSGLFYAMSVMCCPFLVLSYPVFSISCLYRKSHIREFLCVSAGCLVVAIMLSIFILSRASIADIIATIPKCFSDPEHNNRSVFIMLRDWAGHLVLVQGAWSCVPMILCGGLFLYQHFFDNDAEKRTTIYCVLYATMCIILLMAAIAIRPFVDFFTLPICILSVCLFFAIRRGDREHGTICAVVAAFIYAFSICMGSNQGSYVVASVMASAVVPALAIVMHGMSDMVGHKGAVLAFIIISLSIIGSVYSRVNVVWWDKPMNQLTHSIKDGPGRGIVASEELGEWYDGVLSFTRENIPNDDKLFVVFPMSSLWQYFMGPWRIGAYSSWITDMNSGMPEDVLFSRMSKYYELRPNRLPDLVIVNNENTGTIQLLRNKYGYRLSKKNVNRAVMIRAETRTDSN